MARENCGFDEPGLEKRWEKIKKLVEGNDVFLRAEDEWSGWEEFKEKKSFENVDKLEKKDVQHIIKVFKNWHLDKRYDMDYDEKEGIIRSLVAKGINAIPVSDQTICVVVNNLRNMGYGDDEFVFVLFKGKELGTNIVGDGEVVIPIKLVKIMKPSDMFCLCDYLKKK